MGKWDMVRLGDIAIINMGQSPESSTYNQTGEGIPFYQGNADFGERYPVKRFWCSAPKKLSAKGDVLISVRAPIGAMNFSIETCCIGRGLASITPKSQRLEQNYLWYILKSNYEFLNRQGTGSTFKAINKNVLTELLIPLPPLDEQKRIAQNLDLASDIVKGYKEQLAELDKLVQSVFYDMFGDPVTNEKGWEQVALGTICKKITDGKHGGCDVSDKSGYYFVGAKEIRNGKIDYKTAPQITKEHFEEAYRRCNIENGDLVLVNTGATIGKSAIADNEKTPKTLLQKSVALFKTNADSLLPLYLQWCYMINPEMYSVKSASAQPNLLLSKIRETRIILPPLPLQTRFASIVAEIETQKAQVQLALTEAENLSNGLMQEYFE